MNEDLIGKQIGYLTVIENTDDYISPKGQHQSRMLCKCRCGNIIKVSASVLRNNRIKSCGCIKKEYRDQPLKNDLTGQKFGRLEVLRRTEKYYSPKGRSQIQYECKCDCGNIVVATSSNLVKGVTKSCGCLSKELASNRATKSLIGQKFNYLTAIELVGKSKDGQHLYKCKCDCGNEKIVKSRDLRKGTVISCGCTRFSKGELEIKRYLEDDNISFKYDEPIKNLNVSSNIDNLYNKRFDFVILSENLTLCIEFDGIQHFKLDYRAKDGILFANDDAKTSFCEENGIPLLRIKHNQIDKIPEILDIFLKNPLDFIYHHNPYLSNEEYYADRDTFDMEKVCSSVRKVYDHLGNEFPSIKAMCKHWNIPESTYSSRLQRGYYTIEEALTLPWGYKKVQSNEIECEDHIGNKFPSVIKMTEYWGLKRNTFDYRVKNLGWSLKDALTTPT